jgi:EmrB/QacA subfamily drug resistance transporter
MASAVWRVLVVCLGTLVVPLDSTVNVAFPHITRYFNLGIPAIQWLVISYTLTHASLLLVFGRAGDMLGHRRIFLIGTAWSAAAFVLCGMAQSYTWLLLARVAQGVGAGLVLSCGPALATFQFPESQRARALGLFTMMFGLGGALGTPVAGLLVQQWGWSAVFWFRAPIALIAFLLAFQLPAPTRPRAVGVFDAAGAGLLVLTISAMLIAFNQIQHGAYAILAVVIALCGLFGFVRQERRCEKPIIDLQLFRDFDFTLANLANTLINFSGFAIMLLMPFYLARATDLSVPAAGLLLAASPLGIALAGPLAGRLATRIAPRHLTLAGCVLASVGLFAIGSLAAQPNIAALATAMFFQGFGQGLFQVAYFDILTGSIPLRDRGVAGSLGMVTRTIGVVTAATLLMLAFQSLRGSGAGDASAGFLTGFQGAFQIAAAIPALLAIAFVLRAAAGVRRA